MTTETITESIADVAALIQRATWEVMDEDQRDHVMQNVIVPRWGKVTSDGFTLKATAWAQLLGTTVDTIDGRYRRLRRSEGQDGPSAPGTPSLHQLKSTRAARKAIAEHPDLAKELLGDPDVADAIEQHRPHPPEQYDADEFVEPRGVLSAEAVIAGLVRKARRALTDAIAEAKGQTFPADLVGDLHTDLDRVRAATDFLAAALGSEVQDFDQALADLVKDTK